MEAFVIRVPAGPGAAVPGGADRLDRLTAAGWHIETSADAAQIALAGRGAFGRCGAWVAVGLCSLQNGDDLRASHPGAGAGDMALIAYLRTHHGPGLTDLLSGGFAVVLIHKETGAVEVYRDHFGIMPLYYCVHEGALTCSSDIRAALHLSGLPLRDNPVRIADFLAAEEIDAEITAFAGLTRLPAAHRMTWKSSAVRTTRYWTLAVSGQTCPEQAPAEVRERLRKATAGSMQNFAHVGAMLSGGLDSTTLTGLAACILQDRGDAPLPTLSFVYGPRNPMDESDYIDVANADFATAPHKISMETTPRLSDMPEVIEEQMDLFLALGLQKSRNIYRVAEELGLSALLDGHGGDEVISHGFDRLIELAAGRHWWQLFVEMRGTSRIYGQPFLGAYCLFIVRHGGLRERGLLRRLLNRLARLLLPSVTAQTESLGKLDILASDLRDQVDADTRYAEDPGPSTRDERLRAEQTGHLKILQHPRIQIAFEVLHRAAVRQGILPLYPFFDRPLVEYCLSVPAEAKMKDGLSRWVLREAMRGILPEKVRMRTSKTDFTDEFRTTVLEHFRAHREARSDRLESYVDTEAVQRLHTLLSSSQRHPVERLRMYWRLVVLSQWDAARTHWQALQARGELI